MAERTVEVWSNTEDLLALHDNGFSFQFAKSVLGRTGGLDFNIVWQSRPLAPRTMIKWTPTYGLNWNMSVPTQGVAVTIAGIWQKCNLGESYNISNQGFFVPSDNTCPMPKPGYLNVGRNDFELSEESPGVHILIGLMNGDGEFDVIYVDLTLLGLRMNAYYQPQEKCRWWYEGGVKTGTMITGAGTHFDEYDMSQINTQTGQFYVATSYHYDKGTWTNQATKPPPIYEIGLARKAARMNETDLKLLNASILSLSRVLSSLLQKSGNSGLKWGPFHATIIWPERTSESVIIEGVQAACKTLQHLNYFTGNDWDPETHTSSIAFGPFSSSVLPDGLPIYVKTDWDKSFKAIVKGDPENGGVERLMLGQQISGWKAEAEAVMDQRRNGSEDFVDV